MHRDIYRRPAGEKSRYQPYVGARKPPSLQDKRRRRIEWLILAAVAMGVAIASWLDGR